MKSRYSEVKPMDDLQFRRTMYADPKNTDEAIIAAIESDPAKQKFAAELDKLDDKIAQALNVPVPDDLYNKLILRQTMASHQQQKRKGRIQLAIAASVAFAVGITFNTLQVSSPYSNLGDYAIAHVNHEAQYFSNNDNAQVTLASLNQKMASFKGSFASSFGKLISAEYCRFDGIQSLHLTFQGKSSPVTIFIVPANGDLEFSDFFSDDLLNGESLKFKDTNIIVVGDKNEPLQQWRENINKNISFSI